MSVTTLKLYILFLSLISPALCTDNSACPVKLGSQDYAAGIYVNVLKWKEPEVTSSPEGPQLECKTGFLQNELDGTTHQFVCNGGKYNGSYEFSDLLCRSDYHQRIHVQKVTPDTLKSPLFHCNSPNLAVYEVSLRNENSEDLLYWVCLDTNTMRTKYSFKPSHAARNHSYQEYKRYDVWGFDGFGVNSDDRLRLSQAYVQKKQKTRITSLYPEYNRGKEYPYYFERGHLIAYADFSDHEEQKGTVQYLNAAPQWDVLNQNAWSLVEREARSIMKKYPGHWDVYAGTFGSIQTPSGPLTLAPLFDDHGKFVKAHLPVPLVFWKVIDNVEERHRSRVFVGVNNPQIRTGHEIGDAYYLCKYPIPNAAGQRISGDEYKGFTYECPLNDFLRSMKELEKVIADDAIVD